MDSIAFLLTSLFIISVRSLESEQIVGGSYATKGQVNYQVSIQILNNHVCGGSIIADDLILTAGHCVHGDDGKIQKSPYNVKAALMNLKDSTSYVANVIKVYTLKQFKRYADSTIRADIAILRTDSLAIDNSLVLASLNLPEKDEHYVGQMATIFGYGWDTVTLVKNEETGEDNEIGASEGELKSADVNVVSPRYCQGSSFHDGDDLYLCGQVVQNLKTGEGVCSGDSGGSLVYQNTAIGILSTSVFGCNESFGPASYTSVFDYLDFVKGVIEGKLTRDTKVWDVKECYDKKNLVKNNCSGLFKYL